jgi:hypothetical protein
VFFNLGDEQRPVGIWVVYPMAKCRTIEEKMVTIVASHCGVFDGITATD